MEPAGETPADDPYTQDAAGDPQRDRAEAGDRRQQNRHENRGGQKPDDSAKQAAVERFGVEFAAEDFDNGADQKGDNPRDDLQQKRRRQNRDEAGQNGA